MILVADYFGKGFYKMKAPKVETFPTYFRIYDGFNLIGVFSAYQLNQLPEEELGFFWGYQVKE